MKSKEPQLSLKIYPDAVLRQVCEPVQTFDAELRDVIGEMFALMRFLKGIGLAAPQVRMTKRLFVCEIENRPIVLINPTVIDAGGQAEMIEGCLSLPEVQVPVTRSNRFHVQGHDVKGRRRQLELKGLWARVVQHEMDHLNGVLICDYGQNIPVMRL